MDDTAKFEVNIRNSINTDTIEQDFKSFEDASAPMLVNTGIERDGGVTNLYETENTYSEAGQYVITEDGKTISIVNSSTPDYKTIKIDGKSIGQASSYGVEYQFAVEGVEDVFLDSSSYVTCTLIDNVITVSEYDYTQTLLNTRQVTFTNLSDVLKFYTSLSFVRYNGMKYADSLEWALRLGDQVVILKESDTGVTIAKALQSTTALGSSAINASIVYNNQLIVAGVSGKVASFDGSAWKNFDGSGTGTGIFNSGDATLGVVGSNNINCLANYSYGGVSYLVVGGASGRIGSYNGTSWIIWSSGGVVSNNATVISTDNVTAMLQVGEYLIIAGSAGKIGSWNGRTAAFVNYNVAGVSDNATLIGAVSINAMTVWTDPDGYPTLVVAGAGGKVGSMKITGGVNWANVSSPFYTLKASFGNGKFVMLQTNTRNIYSSLDGVSFSIISQLPSIISTSNTRINFGNGLFIAFSSNDRDFATSPDGITWTTYSYPVEYSTGYSFGDYGNGIYLFQNGTNILYTSDFVDWNSSTIVSTDSFSPATYGNGLWVSADSTNNTNACATSPDGITWTVRTMAYTAQLTKPVYANNIWISPSANINFCYTSPDGITWTQRTMPSNYDWSSCVWANGLFVMAKNSTTSIATSPDGITWTARTSTTNVNLNFGLAYGNGVVLQYAISGTGTLSMSYSQSDQSTKSIFSVASTPAYPTNNATVIGANAINAMTVFDSQLVVAGDGGRVGSFGGYGWANYNQTTANMLQTVVKADGSPGSIGWLSVTYGNGLFVAVANTTSTTAGIATSPDGNIWTFQTTTAPGGGWRSVTYGNGLFVALAQTNSTTAGIATSPDGNIWTFQTTTAPGGSWYSITYGNGLFVAVAFTTSTTAGIATSPDGITWTFRTTTAPGGNWLSVTYGNGLFVAVAFTTSTTAGIATSPDGNIWTFQTTTAPGGSWYSITYGNGLFVAVAFTTSTTAGIATSPDGNIWTFQTTTAPGGVWRSVTYGNGLFVALAQTNSTTAGIATSPDGNIWTFQTTTAPGGSWRSVGYGNGKFILTLSSASQWYSMYLLKVAYTDNATVIGSNNINSIQAIGDTLAIGGVGGRLGSFDALAQKTLYTAGTGLSSNAMIIGANDINTMVDYNSQLIVSGATSTTNSITEAGVYTPFYSEGGAVTANLLTGFNSLGYLYTYRYENGLYLINLTGNSVGKAYTLDNATKAINTLNCRFAIPQVSNNLTRHIITTTDQSGRNIYDGSSIKATGLVGYTDFATYSGTVVYPPAPYVLGNGNVLQSQAGFGYTDFTFRLTSSATNIYNYVPQFQSSVTGLYQVVQGNTNTLINAYGKLTNNLGVTPSKPFEFRVGWTNGVQSYISTALLDGIASDSLGTIITNVGEFDDTYTPMWKDDDKIVYLYNNKLIITKIGTNIVDRVQRVDTNIYKLNSISPLNIIDPSDNTLRLGSIDYNNRMLFSSTVAPTVSTKIASFIQGKYSNSIDTGDKLVTILNPTSTNIEVIGYRIPVVATSVNEYSVDTYFNDIYSYSTLNDGSELIVSSRVDTVYAPTTILPVSLGVEYKSGTAQVAGITTFLKPEYDGYSIGNDIVGNYDSFLLFGQTYLFDGNTIFAAQIDVANGIFSSKTPVTSAVGLVHIATTPTEAYFRSNFDNSIYTFEGGRNLNKFKRMNQMPFINSGLFSTVDNSLVLDTDTSFIWVRDGVVTETPKKASQTSLKYYDTVNGIIIGNDQKNWKYTYYKESNSTVVPLSLQTPYFGFNLNEKSILANWVVTIYNENKDQVEITGTSYVIDSDVSRIQNVKWTINPKDYNDGGYARVRLQPQYQRSLGTSLKLDTNDKIIVVSVLPEFRRAETATVAAARSR